MMEHFHGSNAVPSVEMSATAAIRGFGIPANVKGYRYLRNAVMLAVDDVSVLDSVTKLLYPAVARLQNTTPERVERAIRHAISSAWENNRGDSRLLESALSCKVDFCGRKPTNSEFIALVSDCLRLEAKNNS